MHEAMEKWQRDLLHLYSHLPDEEQSRALEAAKLEEAAREEALAFLEQGYPVPGPFQNPVVRVEGRWIEVLRFLTIGEVL